MTERDEKFREQDKKDLRNVAQLLKDSRREGIFNNILGVAMAGYINGIADACRSFKAAQTV